MSETRTAEGPDAEPAGIRVLAVDDAADLATLTALSLERENDRFSVATAGDAAAALDRLEDGRFDCVVSDYDMPGLDGIEFLERVRAEYPDLPFVLFTAKGSEEVASEAISAGVTDYLQKGGGGEAYTILANRVENAVERRRAEGKLRERTRRLETLVDNLPGMVYRCRNEPGWPMEEVGGEVRALTGHDAAAFETGEVAFGDLIHEADREEVWATVQRAVGAGEAFEATYRIDADGETQWVWEQGRAVGDAGADDGPAAIEGFITDITRQRRALADLREERAFAEQALDALDDVFYVVGPDGTLRRWNEELREVTGCDDDELAGTAAVEFFPADERDRVGRAIETAMTAGRATVVADLRTADGGRVPYEFTGSRLTDAEGDPAGLVGIGRALNDGRPRRHGPRADGAPAGRGDGVALGAVARDAWEAIDTGGASLRVAADRTVSDDADRLRRLLEPLLRNAVEHGSPTPASDARRDAPRGAPRHDTGVTVTVGAFAEGVYVADDGPGIPEGERAAVFESGYTLADGGDGMGLTVARDVAAARGWTVSAARSADGGARIEIAGVTLAD